MAEELVDTPDRTIILLRKALGEALEWNWFDDDAPTGLGIFLGKLVANTNQILDNPEYCEQALVYYTNLDHLTTPR